jgi:hypothetical protein
VPLEMSRKAIAAFIAGRAARIILAQSAGPVDLSPTDIIVSNLQIREDAATGLLAYIYATGGDGAVTFTLTANPGDKFSILNGNELHLDEALGSDADIAIEITATDADGDAYAEEFTVDVIPAETEEPDTGIGDDGDVVTPDPEDPETNDDGYVEPPVQQSTEDGLKISGRNGGTTTFLKDWGVPLAGATYTMRYTADWSGMSKFGRKAAIGFGFKDGNDYHLASLRGNGSNPTTMLDSRIYGDFRKTKNFTITNDGAAQNGTKDGPNWLRVVIAEDGTDYTLYSSADGDEWDEELTEELPTPLEAATDALSFGPAGYFASDDNGVFVITIERFQEVVEQGGMGITSAAIAANAIGA